MKIACLNPIAQIGLDLFPGSYELTDDVQEAEGILVRSADMTEMELPANLLAVSRAGAGVNNIPLDRCAEQGTVVFNTPGANANGVKELAIAAMLLASRDIIGGVEWVQSVRDEKGLGKLVEKGKKKFAGTEIMGKKLGVIGLGAIGYRVANAAVSLGMDVYGYDPSIAVVSAWNISHKVKHCKKIEEIYENCDIISIHVPALPATKGMINAAAFEKMHDGMIIINMARDVLVNDDDMAVALASGKVKTYVTDFPNEKTANMPGTIAIPHLGASTEESEDNCAVMAVEEMMNYLDHGNIINSVNFPPCDLGMCTKAARVCIMHKNIPNVINRITNLFSENNINIDDMLSKSRGDYAYAMFDLSSEVPEDFVAKTMEIDGVIRVRVL